MTDSTASLVNRITLLDDCTAAGLHDRTIARRGHERAAVRHR